MPYQCSLSPWASSSFLCLRLCTYHKFYIFSLLRVGSYSEFYVLKGKFRECIIFFLWKDPSLAFRPRSFQNFCLTIDINEYNFILSIEEWPLILSVICSPEEINAMILKWQGYGENLRKEKKLILISSPIIIWLNFLCRVEWILVISYLIPFSSHVITFAVPTDELGRLCAARMAPFPEWSKPKNGSPEFWCPLVRLCFSSVL